MNTYDEGYLREEISLYTRSKLEPDDKTKVFSEADKEKYLESLRAKYPNTKSLEDNMERLNLYLRRIGNISSMKRFMINM